MLTIFSVPKPFLGHTAIIQHNAIKSWTLLYPTCEIILCGDDPGVKEAAAEFKAKQIPDICRNEYGTPLLNSVFDKVPKIASHRLMCYVNADIILLSDFIRAVERIRFPRFLMVGRRWNIRIAEQWDFDQLGWEERLRNYIAEHGIIDTPDAIDYMAFSHDDALTKLPLFAVGRPGWDNWFIQHARKLSIPVIDATRVVKAIHQAHDYSHVPQRKGEKWEGPEADRNRDLMGGGELPFTILDATHVMTSKAIEPAFYYNYLRFSWRPSQLLQLLVRGKRSLIAFKKAALRIVRSLASLVRPR